MKKIPLLIAAMVISIVSMGQIRTNVVTMPDLTTNFAVAIPAYSIISVQSNDNVYLVTSYYATTADMNDVIADGNYVDLTAGGTGLWESGAPGLINPIAGVTRVGIGTATPSEALEVDGNITVGIDDTITASEFWLDAGGYKRKALSFFAYYPILGEDGFAIVGDPLDNGFLVKGSMYDEIIFYNDGDIIMEINDNDVWKFQNNNAYTFDNSVGIGTTTPSAPLDVEGEIEIAGDTSVTAVVGKIVFQSADSSFYGCRSTLANKKWYKLHD